MQPILQIDAGSVVYSAAYAWQLQLHARRVAGEIPDLVVLLEHPSVITLGRRFRPRHLLAPAEELRRRGIEVYEADRGGSITYHGPGQLVAYPVVDLRTESKPNPDVIAYLRLLEAAVLATVADFGVPAELRPGLTGVWVGRDKLGAIGVNVSRGVTKHGMALNVSTDLEFFSSMVPCGIPDAGVTSLQRLLGRPPSIEAVSSVFAGHLARLLGRQLEKGQPEDFGLPVRPESRERVGV
jgi:lipoyl(octanoyl) transferase